MIMKLSRGVLGICKSAEAMAILAILGFAISIYQTWFSDRHPIITYELLSNNKVLDVYTPVSKLDILYAGQSLKSNKLELSLLVVAIKNSGVVDVSKRDFDETAPLGLTITNGKLLEDPILTTSSNYLSEHVKVLKGTDSKITIEPFIFDSGEWIKLQLLIATPSGQQANIIPIGKILGIRQINLIRNSDQPKETSIWADTIKANYKWTHILRSIIYPIGAFISLIVLIFLTVLLGIAISYFPEQKQKHHREFIAKEYAFSRNLTIADQVILEKFKSSGISTIYDFRRFIRRASKHNEVVTAIRGRLDKETVAKILQSYQAFLPELVPGTSSLVSTEDEIIKISEDLVRAVNDFAVYLHAKGELQESTGEKEDEPKQTPHAE